MNELTNMLVQKEARLKQQEHHSIHHVNQGARKKWKKPEKGKKQVSFKINSLLRISRLIIRREMISAISLKSWGLSERLVLM